MQFTLSMTSFLLVNQGYVGVEQNRPFKKRARKNEKEPVKTPLPGRPPHI